MGRIDLRLSELGLVLPQPLKLSPGVELTFPWVRVHGNRAYVSGHGPQNTDGSLAGPFGSVGTEVTLEEAQNAARLAALAMIASLQRELGDLDRISAWLRIFGMVNSAAGFVQQPIIINSCTDLITDVFGDDCGKHARSAVGMAELPFGLPVELEAEVAIDE